jgi:rare lipoprotein A
VCRVNDRGPFVRGRIIDVSTSAARALGMMGAGVIRVVVE